MDTLELAKNIEKEGKAYYEKLANDSSVPALAGIFKLLASEEQRHFDLFDSLQKKKSPGALQAGSVSGEAKKAFEALSTQFTLPETVYDYAKAYSKALEMERKSIAMYEDMLGKSGSDDEKKTLVFLIEEEQKHEHLVEHLLEFVSEPKGFLENAEFNHLDDN
jgi:rubrerythrin